MLRGEITAVSEPRLFFDITGLLHWYAYFRHPTGIQRVIEGLAASQPLWRHPRVEFVARFIGDDSFYRVESSLLARLSVPSERRQVIARLRGLFTAGMRSGRFGMWLGDMRYYHLPYLWAGILRLESAVEATFSGKRPIGRPRPERATPPTRHDVFFHPGDIFWQKRGAATLVELRERTGVRIVELVHDLFPHEHPDWFQAGLVQLFTRGLDQLAPHVDTWLTHSQFVRGQVERYLADRALTNRRVATIPMGWDSFGGASRTPPDPASEELSLRRLGLQDVRFILFVGTVEPRKNLSTLLDAWSRLRDDLGAAVPDLVVVGGRGWRSENVRNRLRRMTGVRWLRGVRDDELVALYRHARFTVAPSYAEGWGLPVQESLALGVPCIASSGGAIPEVANGLAELVDPTDTAALAAAMARWIVNEDALAHARARLAREFERLHLPSWDDSAKALLELVFGVQS